MNPLLRKAIYEVIANDAESSRLFASFAFYAETGTGAIEYNTNNLLIDPNAPGFTNGRTHITDEEMVRAYLVYRLMTHYRYPINRQCIELEKVYKPVGRPQGKGGRIDLLVRKPTAEAFLFIECKAPDKFDSDLKYIDGQLFRLSRQEPTLPRFLVYYTVDLKADGLHDRIILIDTTAFPDYKAWDQAGQPITDIIPREYGLAPK